MVFAATGFWEYFWGLVTVLVGLSLLLLWVYIFIDILRRRGMSAVARVLWIIAIFVVPWIGGLVYLLTRPYDGESTTYFPGHHRDTPLEDAWTAEMARVVALHESGALTDDEFVRAKAKLLA